MADLSKLQASAALAEQKRLSNVKSLAPVSTTTKTTTAPVATSTSTVQPTVKNQDYANYQQQKQIQQNQVAKPNFPSPLPTTTNTSKVGDDTPKDPVGQPGFYTDLAKTDNNQQQFDDLFKTDFNSFFTKVQDKIKSELAGQGKEIDLTNPELQTSLEKFKTESFQKGLVPDAKNAEENIKSIIQNFNAQPNKSTDNQKTPVSTEPVFVLPGIFDEDQRLIVEENQKMKENIVGLSVNEETGLTSYVSRDITVPIKSNKEIDWNNLSAEDAYNLAPEDLMKWIYVTDTRNAINDREATIRNAIDDTAVMMEVLDNRAERHASQTEETRTMISQWADLSQKRLEQGQKDIERDFLYRQAQLNFEKTTTIEDLEEARSSSLAYQKARLHAMGADDSILGLQRINFEEMKWGKEISRVETRYSIEMNHLNSQLMGSRERFVLESEGVEFQVMQKYVELNQALSNDLDSIDESKLLLTREKRDAIFNAKKTFADGIMNIQAQKQAAVKAAEKEAWDRNMKLMETYTKNSGFQYTLDPLGRVALDIGPDGNPVKTFEREKEERSAMKDSLGFQEVDTSLSKELGFLVNKFGEVLPGTDGKAVELPKSVDYQHFFTDDNGKVRAITGDGEIVEFGNFGTTKTKSATASGSYLDEVISGGNTSSYINDEVMAGATKKGIDNPYKYASTDLSALGAVETVPFNGSTRFESTHAGVDVVYKDGQVKAWNDGVVVGVNPDNGGFGISAYILDTIGNLWQYSHLSPLALPKIGTAIQTGMSFAKMGATGSVYSASGGSGAHTDVRIVKQYNSANAVVNEYADMVQNGQLPVNMLPSNQQFDDAVKYVLAQRGFFEESEENTNSPTSTSKVSNNPFADI